MKDKGTSELKKMEESKAPGTLFTAAPATTANEAFRRVNEDPLLRMRWVLVRGMFEFVGDILSDLVLVVESLAAPSSHQLTKRRRQFGWVDLAGGLCPELGRASRGVGWTERGSQFFGVFGCG